MRPALSELKLEITPIPQPPEIDVLDKRQRRIIRERQDLIDQQSNLRRILNAMPEAQKLAAQARKGFSGPGSKAKRDNAEQNTLHEFRWRDPEYKALVDQMGETDRQSDAVEDQIVALKAQHEQAVEAATERAEQAFRDKLREYPWWECAIYLAGADWHAKDRVEPDKLIREYLAAEDERMWETAQKYHLFAMPDGLTQEMVARWRDSIRELPTVAASPRGPKERTADVLPLFGDTWPAILNRGLERQPPQYVVCRQVERARAPMAAQPGDEHYNVDYSRWREIASNLPNLKSFIRAIPEFELDPVLTVLPAGAESLSLGVPNSKHPFPPHGCRLLEFRGGGIFRLCPAAFGIVLPDSVPTGAAIWLDVEKIRSFKAGGDRYNRLALLVEPRTTEADNATQQATA